MPLDHTFMSKTHLILYTFLEELFPERIMQLTISCVIGASEIQVLATLQTLGSNIE